MLKVLKLNEENIKAKKYNKPAKKYKKENPKYIELYSKKPPNIAPKIFDDNALETEFNLNNSFENANPENKIGKAKIKGNTKLIIFFWIDSNP